MQPIRHLKLTGKLAAVVSLEPVIRHAVRARQANVLNLEGYPSSPHVVGKLQKEFDTESYPKLISSIKKLRDLARLASVVLDTMPLAKVDRQVIDRTELLSYITTNAQGFGFPNQTPDELAFIADLIVSGESSLGSWMLEFALNGDNRHIKFANLYATLSKPVVPSGDKSSITIGSFGGDAIYSPGNDEIIPFDKSSIMRPVLNQYMKTDDQTERENLTREANHLCTIQRLAALRIIDHIHCLLNSRDIWDAFITPRTNSDPNQNIERVRSLKLFAGYLQSLLMYPYLLHVELAYQGYHAVQEQFMQFPPLESHTLNLYTETVRKHDVLGAKEDANLLLNAYDGIGPDEVKLTPIIEELTELIGIANAYHTARITAADATTPIKIDSLQTLKDPRYNPYLFAHPVAEFDLLGQISERLFVGDAMKELLEKAARSLMPALPLYLSDEVISGLNKLHPRVPFGISQPLRMTGEVTATSTPQLEGGSYRFSTNTIAALRPVRKHFRRDAVLTIFRQSEYTNANSKYLPQIGYSPTVAKKYRSILGMEWHSAYPADLYPGSSVPELQSIGSNESIKKAFFESISGMSYPMFELTLPNANVLKRWATYISSYALVFYRKGTLVSAPKAKKDATPDFDFTATVVEGHGHPYGTTYLNLLALQSFEPDDLIQLTSNIYIGLLKKVPKPAEEIRAVKDFYDVHPTYFFAAGGDTVDVTGWVMNEGLLHMANFPLVVQEDVPAILLDRRAVYLNDLLREQFNIAYDLPPASDSKYEMVFPIDRKKWKEDVIVNFLEYVTIGKYGAVGEASVSDLQTMANLVAQSDRDLKAVEAASTLAPGKEPKNLIPSSAKIEAIDEGSASGAGNVNRKKKSNKGGKLKGNKPGNGELADDASEIEDGESK